MTYPTSSRERSSRVEIEYHKRPNRFRRAAWWTALGAVILAAAWVGYESVSGNTAIYQAGAVSTPHALIEHDCAKCHSLSDPIVADLALADGTAGDYKDGLWGPLRRLMTMNDNVHSVSNANCQACHLGPLHHENQWPMHGDSLAELSCAECHREHKGDQQLAWVADRHCTRCHAQLPDHTTDGAVHFAHSVTDFADPNGHPDFLYERLLRSEAPTKTTVSPEPGYGIVGYEALDGDEPKWRDLARIRFNHEAHLKGMFGEGGSSDVKRRKGTDAGQPIGYPQSCADCHQPDATGRYMQPIVYEQHCAQCHPLGFDTEKFVMQPGPDGAPQKVALTVPHESPEIVRGFLTQLYTLQAMGTKQPANDDPLLELRRGFPGEDFPITLNSKLAEELRARIDEEERELYPQSFLENEVARRKGEKVLFKENGACALCHEVRPRTESSQGQWEIVPPQIPERWYPHSRFKHDSHRMLSCVECHSDLASGRPVWESRSTGDVLMPTKQSCIRCHHGDHPATVDVRSRSFSSARTDCVECHSYHDHTKENFDGKLNAELLPRHGKNRETDEPQNTN